MATSDELATEFYRRGLANTWLSVNRTNFLRNIALREHDREREQAERRGERIERTMYANHVNGLLNAGDLKLASWNMRVSPVNGCGFFAVRVSDIPTLNVNHLAEVSAAAADMAARERWGQDLPLNRDAMLEYVTSRIWMKGYLMAAHEYEAWSDYETGIALALAGWDRNRDAIMTDVPAA